MSKFPIGELCVMRYPQASHWLVCVCHGPTGKRETLGRFWDMSTATEFATTERDKRAGQGRTIAVHFPDDCPCCGKA